MPIKETVGMFTMTAGDAQSYIHITYSPRDTSQTTDNREGGMLYPKPLTQFKPIEESLASLVSDNSNNFLMAAQPGAYFYASATRFPVGCFLHFRFRLF